MTGSICVTAAALLLRLARCNTLPALILLAFCTLAVRARGTPTFVALLCTAAVLAVGTGVWLSSVAGAGFLAPGLGALRAGALLSCRRRGRALAAAFPCARVAAPPVLGRAAA